MEKLAKDSQAFMSTLSCSEKDIQEPRYFKLLVNVKDYLWHLIVFVHANKYYYLYSIYLRAFIYFFCIWLTIVSYMLQYEGMTLLLWKNSMGGKKTH